jgi:CheY-like chemotaxis protein
MEPVYAIDQAEISDAGNLPVLIVEDNREEIFIHERCLNGTRFQIVPAKTIKDARKILRTIRPIAIVLDVLLRGEHSWDLLQELKHDPVTANIPVFMVTIVDNREKALALGADGFHTKPVDRTWLIRKLEEVVSHVARRELLLIDDDEASRYLVKSALGRTDFVISEASNGREGLRKALEEEPDAVILDLSMPDLSGFEVLAKLKQDIHTASIPVIIHTSKVLDAREREMLSEAAAIVSKEGASRELLFEHFARAFHDAGFPIEAAPLKEAHHD